jgi:hypothetical protein
MRTNAPGDATRNGYDDNTEACDDDPNAAPSETDRKTARRRRCAPATINDVQIESIETVEMTAAEETEAIHALAVLVASYWRTHPDSIG